MEELSGEGVDEGAEETERDRHHQDLQFIAHGGFLEIDFKTHFLASALKGPIFFSNLVFNGSRFHNLEPLNRKPDLDMVRLHFLELISLLR